MREWWWRVTSGYYGTSEDMVGMLVLMLVGVEVYVAIYAAGEGWWQ